MPILTKEGYPLTKDQINLIKDACLTDDGTGNPIASVFTVLFNDEISFRNTDDFVIWDDNNELVHVIRQNFDGVMQSCAFPYKVSTGFYGNIQFLEGLYNMGNFEKIVDKLFLDTGLIDDKKKEMIMTWARNVRNHYPTPMHPGPYYPTVPHIPPHPPVMPECRPDGIYHCGPIDQVTKKNKIYKIIDPLINNCVDVEFVSVRHAYYNATAFDMTALANIFKRFIEGMGRDLFYATLTDNDSAAIYNPRIQESIDDFIDNSVGHVLPQKKNTSRLITMYIEAYGVRVKYEFCISYKNDDAADELWKTNTSANIVSFVESINDPAVDSVVVNNDYDFSAVINTTNDLDIGLTDFLYTIDGVKRVTWNVNGRTYSMEVGNEPSKGIFKKGVVDSMPTSNNEVSNCSVTIMSENNVSLKYTLKVKYFNEAEAIAKIGDKYFSKIEDAFASATSGQTIDILQDVSIDNKVVSTTTNYPVLVINDGVTVNGNNHTITTKDWVTSPDGRYGTNHIIGISSGSATIKDLNVVGNENCKSGIVCYGTGTNVTINNVTAKDCGNCGVQVAGATVDATNLNTIGNTWGAVNVDKGSDGSIPAFTMNSGTLSENVEIYTEIKDSDVITAPGYEKVTGYGTNLKGFVYYTTDVSKLGKIVDESAVYETFADVVANNPNASVTISDSITEDITIPVGSNITIDGNSNTIHGAITCDAAGASPSSLTLKNMTLNGDGTKAYGIRSQNQTDSDQMELTLILNNVNITGFTSKGIYGTNIKVLTIDGGTISECATGAMDDPNTKGDYTIDLNLVAVQGTVVDINGVTFSGDLGDKAAVKITQRGGASDAGASDIPKGVGEAKVESVTFTNCDFAASTTDVDFRIGTDNKTEGEDIANTTGSYIVKITGTPMKVVSAYKTPEETLEIPEGRDASKAADGDIALDPSADDQINDIISSMTGVTVEPDPETPNTYSITTNNGIISDTGLFDQITEIDNLTSIVVEDGTGKSETYTAGGDLEAFKTAVDAMIPKTNESGEVTLTMTVNIG